ncbi:MAG: 6-phosphofructokinase [Ottowia sp.]
MRVGILTGGGDCPGLNAVIRATAKSLLRRGASVVGIADGFAGLMQGNVRELDWSAVSGILFSGGTILGTSNRADPLANAAATAQTVQQARALGLDAIVAIGGNGTMTIAAGLSAHGLRFVGVPKTIDNDIEGCAQSFGFDTAVATVTRALEQVQTTGQSHGRVMIVETMGRYAGWIALQAGIAGAADAILLPEIDFDPAALVRVCQQRENQHAHTVICIAEGAKPLGGELTVERVLENSPDPLRLGGVAHTLRALLEPHLRSEVRATVLGHVQRGGPPTAYDRVLATQFGHHAAQMVLAGRTGRMVTLASDAPGSALGDIPLTAVAERTRCVPQDHPLLTTAREIGVSLGDA